MHPGAWSRSGGSPLERLVHALTEAVRGRHVRTWILAVLAVTLIGTAGYVVLFRWPIDDAVYMTVITLTTVGFREVHELVGFPDRLWTMILAVAGVGIIFGSIGIVAETIISEAASGRREAKRMREAVEAMGDATDDTTLRAAGIERARGLITTVDSDANNVYITLSARAMNPALFIVARASAASAEAKLLQAGANRVVSPYTMAGRRAAELAIRPRVADFIDAALSHGNLSFSLEEVEVVTGSPLLGVTVGELRADGVVTLAILQPGGAYEANPPAERALSAGESLITSGSTEALSALRARA
jgi:voltage-gated potassium channel